MTINICPKYKKCDIFQGVSGSKVQGVYKNMYCNAGKNMFETCKRYLVSEKVKVGPPADILPNSFHTVDEIIEIMKAEGLLD